MKTLLTNLLFAALTTLFAACETTTNESDTSGKMQGYALSGELSSCSPIPAESICTEVFTLQDQFALECRKAGHIAIQCACHEFLCQTEDGRPPKLKSFRIND